MKRGIKMRNQSGYSLLEMLVTIGIVGALFTVVAQSGLDTNETKKAAKNIVNSLEDELTKIKNESLSRSTTTRMVLTNNSGTYTINTYYSSAPTTTCTSGGGTWILISSKTLQVNGQYEVVGNAMANTCFYRDSSASGGTYTVEPVDGDSSLPSYDITIAVATGYIDVTEN